MVVWAGAVVGFLGIAYGMYDSYTAIYRIQAPTPEDLQGGVQILIASGAFGCIAVLLGMYVRIRALTNLKRLDGNESRSH
jgi:hypothetical protein